jgi:2-C-methyl-D-erythritol 2,4-cyclodiphosphate synthase
LDTLRIGHGFDVHRFQRGRKLILGGVEIDHPSGLAGHSDADVLLHALMNAILGAMGKGDIGVYFPDSDKRYKGISSEKLLAQVLAMMRRQRFTIVNADATLVAQQPRLAPYYDRIRKNVSTLLKIPSERFNIKAGTAEKLGDLGRAKGIAATAVVLLRKGPAASRRGREPQPHKTVFVEDAQPKRRS